MASPLLHSLPVRWGVGPAPRIAFGCHLVMLVLLLALYFFAAPPLGIVYLVVLGLVAALLFYEHAIVAPQNLSRVNEAFFNVNAIISVGLLIALLVEIAWGRG